MVAGNLLVLLITTPGPDDEFKFSCENLGRCDPDSHLEF